MASLAPLDHASRQYEEFCKDFYAEPSALASETWQEVRPVAQAKMGMKM